MFADKSYEGWEELSPRQKVERMLAIHKSGHEDGGEEVSFCFRFLSLLFYPNCPQSTEKKTICSFWFVAMRYYSKNISIDPSSFLLSCRPPLSDPCILEETYLQIRCMYMN